MLLAKRPQEMFSTTLIDNFLNDDWVKNLYKKVTATPAINVIETDSEYDMEMAVPGLTKEDLNVQVDENCLNISMEKKTETEHKNEKKNYLRREFSTQQFFRSFELPENVEKEKITAKVENGVLKIALPKVVHVEKKPQPKEIAIG
ncbi:MAG: Hsp20/alpha crystallin family protein [Bacteroidales bacterium]|nr:Hsp20/alpha crystallin family protein [Bacteroidales bacterium]